MVNLAHTATREPNAANRSGPKASPTHKPTLKDCAQGCGAWRI
jgi:hypothetical protein